MNKTAIKNFAVWARNKLIADISYRAGMIGITESGIASALPQSTGTTEFYDIGTSEPYSISGDAVRQRRRLVELIERKEMETDYKTAYKYIIEEVAYTWFNRLIAIRFMEVNDYLPSHIRVLSSESGKMEPDLVTTPFDADLEFSNEEEKMIVKLKQNNQLDELFRMLFIKQCNALNSILPSLFEKTQDYTELLLHISFIDQDGIVYHLVNDIPVTDFDVDQGGQVEIIGWLYQYYNTEPKNEAFAKDGKISKNEIPAMTQLFTPDWIVRFMVENSLGRLWASGHENSDVKNEWKYYVEECVQDIHVQNKIEIINQEYANWSLEKIKCIDPCMGSGHILVYVFDVLMQLYELQGYTKRDAVQSILENNLYGLDLDTRAAQLAYFAIMMKARKYDRRFLNRGMVPHVLEIKESNNINKKHLKYFGASLSEADRKEILSQFEQLIDEFHDAKEYGSILRIKQYDWELLTTCLTDVNINEQLSFDTYDIDDTRSQLQYLIMLGKVLAQKYEVVITNPPYMAISSAEPKLYNHINDNYPDSKTDMFAVFMERCGQFLVPNGIQAMITMHSWMFIASYEKLRKKISTRDLLCMVHLGARAFEEIGGEVVQTTCFVLRQSNNDDYKGVYFRLVEPNTQRGKEEMFLACQNRYIASKNDFSKIPGEPYAYWLGKDVFNTFDLPKVSKYISPRIGLVTGDTGRFLRLWYEVPKGKIKFDCISSEDSVKSKMKWFPYQKGGAYRKWYGNNEYVINWENDGWECKNDNFSGKRVKSHNYNGEYAFRQAITWTKISSGNFACRFVPQGYMFDDAGPICSVAEDDINLFIGLLNSKVGTFYLSILSPTMNFLPGHINAIPVDYKKLKSNQECEYLVNEQIMLSKAEWDSFETSWDFEEHPLVRIAKGLWDATAVGAAIHYYYKEHIKVNSSLELCYLVWQGECKERFDKLKKNEERINSLFIEAYGLGKELDPKVDDKEITIRMADINRDIRSLISYAVGCMFGRYSLDKLGVVCADGDWEKHSYHVYQPDIDNCIPITDEEYFTDDIVGRFCEWLKTVFGENDLEANLDYIAHVLGNKGNTSREVIRNYFLNDFIKDHNKIYQKRPIYWLFDSGKQNGFKALVYMHRWNADTIGNLRVDYLHRMQRIYESEINRMQDMIDHSTNAREVATATKRKEKLQKQLKECREYDEKIGHLALSRIDIDLDDGVKVNYEKVQTASDGKKYQVLAKI